MRYILETQNVTKRFARAPFAPAARTASAHRSAAPAASASRHSAPATSASAAPSSRSTPAARSTEEPAAVDGVSLHVPEGSVYGLLGPNGAGKSTLLKMVTGMLRPTEGRILFDGRPWQRADLQRIGSLIETPALYPNLTARENLRVRALLLDVSEQRIDDALETVGLADTGAKRAGQFSLGMKQRLGIALTLLARPRLLILDEPTNGLDPLGIEDLRRMIRGFPEQGMTVVVSSHILSEVSNMADRVGIITNGRLAYEGALRPDDDLERLFMDVCRGVRVACAEGGAR